MKRARKIVEYALSRGDITDPSDIADVLFEQGFTPEIVATLVKEAQDYLDVVD